MRYLDLKGVHIVKRIDGFHRPARYSRSIDVHVDLEAVKDITASQLLALNGEEVTAILGDFGGKDTNRSYVRVQVPAGEFAHFQIGDVLDEGVVRGSLKGIEATVSCCLPESSGFWDSLSKPVRRLPVGGWRFEDMLAPGEHHAGPKNNNQFLLFWDNDVEYVLPKTVVFRAFYAFSTGFVNSLLGTTWAEALSELAVPEPAYQDPERGTIWPLRLKPRTPANQAIVRQLALFCFSRHARASISRLHSDWVKSDSATWFCSADLPHDTSGGFRMKVKGYPLHRYAERVRRVLVTSILASDWTAGDAVIEELRDEVNPSLGDVAHQDDAPGFPIRLGIKADPDAKFGTNLDPGESSLHQESLGQFVYLNSAPAVVRKFTKSVQGEVARRKAWVKVQEPVLELSGGIKMPGEGRPAQAEVQTDHREPSKRLEGLENSLSRLEDLGVIDSFTVEAPTNPRLRVSPHGTSSWALVDPDSPRPSRSENDDSWFWAWVWDAPRQGTALSFKRVKNPRALTVYRITIGSWHGLLLDIERRPTRSDESFRMFLIAGPKEKIDDSKMKPVLKRLRDSKGVIRDVDLSIAFGALGGQARAKNHASVDDPVRSALVKRQNARKLGEWLLQSADPSSTGMEDRWVALRSMSLV